MPPKGKGKRVHNTRSMLARSRSNSPLRVKVTNNLAKPKTKERSKQPLKSVVKVITSKQAKATNVLFASQDSALLASQPPKQTAFADAMEKWKRSMVHAINSVPTPCVGEQVAMVHTPTSHSQIFKQATESVPQWDGALQLVEDDNPLLVAHIDSDNGFGGGPDLQFGMMIHNHFHRAMWARMWTVTNRLWIWTWRIIRCPCPGGTQLMLLWLLPLHHRGLFN